MRTMPLGGALVVGALTASLVSAPVLKAQAGNPYPATLQFGTGIINIPVAWISPTNADLWIQTSGKGIPYYVDPSEMNFATKVNSNISLETHWLGRFSVGVSAYSQNPEYGFFGQALLLKPGQFAFLPGIAVGVRNVGKYNKEDRLLVAHDIELQGTGYEEVIANYADRFDTSPTVYGVATQNFQLGGTEAGVTVGYGNGLFSEDGGLGRAYNDKGQIASGLFLGTRFVFHPSLNTTLSFLGENDGWDWNAGLVGDYRGISVGVYGTELEEGGKDCATNDRGLCRVYNYSKLNVSLGYNGNIVDISRGVILRGRVTDLTREQKRLRAEIIARERRIRRLEAELRRAQAGELAEIARRRQELERQITDEREAIKRAVERLEQLEKGRPPATPPSNPPQSSGITPPSY